MAYGKIIDHWQMLGTGNLLVAITPATDLNIISFSDVIILQEDNFDKKTVCDVLNKLKDRKAPGPNKLKAENYKLLKNEPLFISTIHSCMNNAIDRPPLS